MANNYLDGITVVELGQLTGVPRAGKLLRALGARVIKLEPPHISDTARDYGPFPGGVPDRDRSGLYLLLNSGKESVTLDITVEAGRGPHRMEL